MSNFPIDWNRQIIEAIELIDKAGGRTDFMDDLMHGSSGKKKLFRHLFPITKNKLTA